MADAKLPTLWAHFEHGELVNVEARLLDLCCAPGEAIRYEAFDEADRNAARIELLEEVTELGIELMKQTMADTRMDHASKMASLSGGVFAEAIRKTREKYTR